MNSLAHLGRSALDLLFPPRCPLCTTDPPRSGRRFCQWCDTTLAEERAEPACPTCGRSVAPFELLDGRCRDCRAEGSNITATARVGPDGQLLGTLVRAYKYRGREELEAILAEWLAESIAGTLWLARVEAVVSVPTHWQHRLQRPLHAAESLARRIALKIDRPYMKALRRTRAGRHQVGLPYTERIINVRGAFAMRSRAKLLRTRLLLIDDVRTTGATIEECARVLRRAGATEIYAGIVVKVGRGSRPHDVPSPL